MPRYWLVKSEPSAFAWADLLRAPQRTTCWDGVRNYQARNFLRDGMAKGDEVFFYQSCTVPLGIVGTMRVTRAAYPDPTQFDPRHAGFDGRSPPDAPRWYAVDVRYGKTLARVVTLAAMREEPELAGMALLRPGSRLSVQPVSPSAWQHVCAMATASGRKK